MTAMEGASTDMLKGTIAATAVLVISLPACGGSDEPPACLNPQAARTVTMDDFVYLPDCLEATAGAELEIANEGQAPHTFTVESDGPAAEVDVAAGERATLTVPDLAAGTYRVICTYHPQMEAALRVSG
jgi:plastocyanin